MMTSNLAIISFDYLASIYSIASVECRIYSIPKFVQPAIAKSIFRH
jgi:hypothetical protein